MKTIRILYFMILLLISSGISAQDQLNKYLQIAAENNAGLQARFNDYLAALEKAPQVKALPDPQVAFAYFVQPVETRMGPQQFRFSASQMFPWFGSLQAKENVEIQKAKEKYEQFLETKSELFNELRSSWYDIYFNHQAISITNENLTLLESLKRLAKVKIESGKSSMLDEYRIDMELADLQNQLASLKDQNEVLKVSFIKLMNSPDDPFDIQTVQLTEMDFNLSKAQLLDSVKTQNHQLKSLSLKQMALQYQQDVAEKTGKPSFSIGFDYTVVGKGSNSLPGTDAFIFPKVGLSIPLYRNKYKAMVNEVVLLQESNKQRLEDKTNMLEVVFEKAWKNYLDAVRRMELFTSQTSLANQSLKLLETEYASDKQSFEELLRMERRLLQYKLELEKATADKQSTISFIHYLMGK